MWKVSSRGGDKPKHIVLRTFHSGSKQEVRIDDEACPDGDCDGDDGAVAAVAAAHVPDLRDGRDAPGGADTDVGGREGGRGRGGGGGEGQGQERPAQAPHSGGTLGTLTLRILLNPVQDSALSYLRDVALSCAGYYKNA